GVGGRHGRPTFGVEQPVETSMPRIHARSADCFDLLLRQLGGGKAAAAFAEALELLIFVGADEVTGDLAVTRNGNRLALRAHAVAAEITGELGSRDGFGRIHGSSPLSANICQLRKTRKLRKSRARRRVSSGRRIGATATYRDANAEVVCPASPR